MRKILLVLAAVLISAGIIHAQQDTVTGFTFPADSGPDSLNANYGTDQNMGYDIRFEDDATGDQGDVSLTNGAGGDGYSATADGWDNGANNKYWSIKFKTYDFKEMMLYSKQRSGGNKPGPKYFKIQYRISGSDVWTDLTSTDIEVANDWSTGVVDGLVLPGEVSNCPESVYIRWLMASNESSGGGDVQPDGVSKIDDIFVIGTNNEGVEEILFAKVKVFPNPASESIAIDAPFNIQRVDIYAINGALIKSYDASQVHDMKLGNISKGKYLLSIYKDNTTKITKKLIIE